MKHDYLDYDAAHNYVKRFAKITTSKRSVEVFWDNYDVMIWTKNPSGYMVKNGMFRNGKWGTLRRVRLSERGTWRLPVTP